MVCIDTQCIRILQEVRRGAFGVARFDLSGNARASIRESGDRRDSTLEPISVFYNANNQLKH